jgi:glutathione S-transferase
MAARPLRLYAFHLAPNPIRAIIFAREKRLDLNIVYVDASNYRKFCELNPFRRAPVLELADGRVITESLTICQYMDSVAGPPFLFGDDPDRRLEIAMWERRAEMELLNQVIEVYHHIHPMFRATVSRSSAQAAHSFARVRQFLAVLERRLRETSYLAGDGFTAADITAYIGYFWLSAMKVLPEEPMPAIADWAAQIKIRESVESLHAIAPLLDIHASHWAEAE